MRRAFRFWNWIITTTRQPLGAPRVDRCVTRDVNGRRYEGRAILIRPEVNRYGEMSGTALVVARASR